MVELISSMEVHMESNWVAPGTGSTVREIAAAVALNEDGSGTWIEANNAVVELRHMVGPLYRTRLQIKIEKLQAYSLERVIALKDELEAAKRPTQ